MWKNVEKERREVSKTGRQMENKKKESKIDTARNTEGQRTARD